MSEGVISKSDVDLQVMIVGGVVVEQSPEERNRDYSPEQWCVVSDEERGNIVLRLSDLAGPNSHLINQHVFSTLY